MGMMVRQRNNEREAFRAGFFHRGAANPYTFSSMMWEAWEIGRMFQKKGEGFFNIKRSAVGSTYSVEDGRTACVRYGGKGKFEALIE